MKNSKINTTWTSIKNKPENYFSGFFKVEVIMREVNFMTNKQVLIKEIEMLPSDFIDEVYRYISFLKLLIERMDPDEITLASERALAKDWLLPEEDKAWANL